jgi:hypothetical protein
MVAKIVDSKLKLKQPDPSSQNYQIQNFKKIAQQFLVCFMLTDKDMDET